MADRAANLTRSLLQDIFGPDPDGIAVRLWDGSLWRRHPAAPRATLVLKHPGALRSMFLSATELRLSEAYLYDDFDVEGDLESVFTSAAAIPARFKSWAARARLASRLLRLPADSSRASGAAERGSAQLSGRRHSVERDREAIAYHYDVSNDFYRLFLDERMIYSCAYYEDPACGLDAAQVAKLDMICRKLRLESGQRLLDVGCGWGGLVMHAAQHYGVDATGITLSQQQVALANERIARAGLGDRARVLLQDYREVDASHPWDALVSVGMFEHVGEALLPTYFARALELVRPGGVFLNHGIARGWGALGSSLHARLTAATGGRSFSDAYVFPDGELLPIGHTLLTAERAGWEVRDVESLREHYATTLRHWVRRLEESHEQALAHVPEPTYRVWRLYMAGSASGFASGRLSVYQTLLARADGQGRSGLPPTRADWYSPTQARAA